MDRQDVSEWLQNCKPPRKVSLGAEMDIDVDVAPSRSGATQGQIHLHLPPVSIMSTSMTNNTRQAQLKVAYQFFMAHKAWTDPHNVLQLITRYSNKEILAWANEEIQRPILNEKQLKELSQTAISELALAIDNGEEMLRNTIQLARQHHRLHCYHMNSSNHHQRRNGATLVSQDMESWYSRISNAVESDVKEKKKWSQAYRGSATSLGKILGDSMYDLSFTYRSLQEIPDRVVLEYCISHSYEHVADNINLNNARAEIRPQDVADRVKMVLHDPAVWDIAITTTQTSTKEKTLPTIQLLPHVMAPPSVIRIQAPGPPTADDYFKKCASCLDIGAKSCLTKRVHGKSLSRKPGQDCTKCRTLKVVCTDRLKPVKVALPFVPTRAPCTRCVQEGFRCVLSSSSRCCEGCAWELNQCNRVLCSYILDEYRQRQPTGGHERETIKQGACDNSASNFLRQQIFRLLDCTGDAPYNTTPDEAVSYSKFKEGELRRVIASLSQTTSEVQNLMAEIAASESASQFPQIVIDDDSDKETVKAPVDFDEDDCLEPDDHYDSMCDSFVDEVMFD